MSLFKKTFIPALVLVVAASGCSTFDKSRLTSDQKELNLESFDMVWTTVRDRHFDADLNGLDWLAMREQYRPRVVEAETMQESRAAMQEMLGRLGQSHFGIIPRDSYDDIDHDGDADSDAGTGSANRQSESASTGGKGGGGEGETKPPSRIDTGYAGLDTRVIDGKAIISRVSPGFPGDEAGIKTGWEVVKINGRDTASMIKAISTQYADSTLLEFMLARVTSRRFHGDVDDVVELELLDGEGREQHRTITLVSEPGERTTIMGMPESVVRIQHKLLDGNIGYITFNGFWHPNYLMSEFNKAMTSFMSADGVIIDIRQNFGGIGALSMGMAGWLIGEKNQQLGTMYMRDHEMKFIVFPRAKTYDGPVAVIVDGLSVSTSEIFAGGLQDLGRTRTFGTRTAGAALPSIIDRLPNGDGFQYVFANYVSKGGSELEAVGVLPDEVVELSRESLLAGEDNVLQAAIDWIRSTNDDKNS